MWKNIINKLIFTEQNAMGLIEKLCAAFVINDLHATLHFHVTAL